MQEWQDSQFLERADSGAIAAVHDAALVHILVGCLTALVHIMVNVLALVHTRFQCSTSLAGKGWQDTDTQSNLKCCMLCMR